MNAPMKRGRIWPLIRKVWITVGLGAAAIFIGWSLLAYRASGAAKDAWQSGNGVSVVDDGDGIRHMTPAAANASGAHLIFFPGALVDPRAYGPLLRAVVNAGFPVTLVELPRRAAFGGAESLELERRVERALGGAGDAAHVVVGGHSRGGVVASAVAARHGTAIGGLVLIGTSHPRDVDLSTLQIPVRKIVGTRDGLASRAEVEANAALLPPQTKWTWIEGGNHSQFGWYGFQPLDHRPRINAAEQRAQMIEQVIALMHEVNERAAGTDAEPPLQPR